ncbi:NACHT domain-containing protein [Streptomyces sp. NPDC059909]|uniref:NACHT domain-containing protein n=1 Tax=Streptomyces sp. NPDC059909 TaxID=3346998 RepID=UPI00365ABE6A
MEPALIGTRLASAAIAPLLKQLLVREGSGAGLTDKPVRLAGLVSFRGEKRALTDKDVRKLADTLVRQSQAGPGEPPFPPDETEAVADALARTLLALGDLEMDDVQAVRLGHRELARLLRTSEGARRAEAGLSADATLYLDSVTEWACLHILQFFTQRSSFVARTLVEQSRVQAELLARLDELIVRMPRADGRDVAFERRYLSYVAKKHGNLTIYGIDLHHSPDAWPIDLAYLSLEASEAESPDRLAALETAAGSEAEPSAHTVKAALREHHVPVRADEALARHDKVLLRGVAGSGKTTLVQWLAVSSTSQDRDCGATERMAYLRDRIPFVLPLRTLTRHGERLPAPDRFLAAVGCPLGPPDGWADRVLSAGRGLVLIDGIDEIPEAERERTRRWLRDLLATYDTDSGNRWLVTSRPSAVRDDWLTPDGFTELTLSPMSRTEVTSFVHRWHRAAGPDAASYEQPLLDALRTKQDLAQLATNPLTCGLICALHRDRRGFLPRGRKALYEAALAMLLDRRDRERDMGTPSGVDLPEAPQIQLIQRLAYWLTLNGRTVMDRSRAEALVAAAIPAVPEAAAAGDPQAVFGHLLHRSGLLREPSPGTVDFVHRTFQDYLAAKAIVDEWHIGVLTQHAADDQWEDVIRMTVTHARPRECAEILRELMAAADAAQDRVTQLRILVVAAAAMDQATEISPDIREALGTRTAEVIPPRTADEARELATAGPLVLDLLPGPDAVPDKEAARMSVITASHIASDAAIPFLARYASHPSLLVRSQLVWAWDRHETRHYADEVIAAVDTTGLQFTIRSAEQAEALIALGGREWIHFSGDLPPELIGRTVRACSPDMIRISRNRSLTDLSCLPKTPGLAYLEVDRCPGLTDLSLPGNVLVGELVVDNEQFERTEAAPRVGRLRLELRARGHALQRVPRLFPDLAAAVVDHCFPGRDFVADLSPLHAMEKLRTVQLYGSSERFTGMDGFPADVRVVIDRTR